LRHEIKLRQPKIIINAAGATNTTALEQRKNVTEGFIANVVFPALLAQILDELKDGTVRLIHFSTGMIHDGPGREMGCQDEYAQPASRQSVYSRQKMLADYILSAREYGAIESCHQIAILRIHQPFSAIDHPRNFFTRMKTFSHYLDEKSSMTCIEDTFALIDELPALANGIIHTTNPGLISPYDIAIQMKQLGLLESPDKEVEPMTRADLDKYTSETGGAYQPRVMLESDKLGFCSEPMRPIEAAVTDTLRQMAAKRAAV